MIPMDQITQLPESSWDIRWPSTAYSEDELHSSQGATRRNTRVCSSSGWSVSTPAIACGSGPDPDATSPVAWAVSRAETDKRFAALVKARSPHRSQEFAFLVSRAMAGEILAVALSQYEQYGYEGRLSLAADILSEMGDEGWRTLKGFCETGRAECVYFVDAVAAFRGVRHWNESVH